MGGLTMEETVRLFEEMGYDLDGVAAYYARATKNADGTYYLVTPAAEALENGWAMILNDAEDRLRLFVMPAGSIRRDELCAKGEGQSVIDLRISCDGFTDMGSGYPFMGFLAETMVYAISGDFFDGVVCHKFHREGDPGNGENVKSYEHYVNEGFDMIRPRLARFVEDVFVQRYGEKDWMNGVHDDAGKSWQENCGGDAERYIRSRNVGDWTKALKTLEGEWPFIKLYTDSFVLDYCHELDDLWSRMTSVPHVPFGCDDALGALGVARSFAEYFGDRACTDRIDVLNSRMMDEKGIVIHVYRIFIDPRPRSVGPAYIRPHSPIRPPLACGWLPPAWFVSYMYYGRVDQTQLGWLNVTNPSKNVDSYEKLTDEDLRHNLEDCLKSDDDAWLEDEVVGLSAGDVRRMAGELLDLLDSGEE